MQKYSQKWTIVQFLEPVADGAMFSMQQWPLHVTLVDVFAVDWEADDLLENARKLLARTRPLRLTAGDDTVFGTPPNQVGVTLLKNTPSLQLLHDNMVDMLQQSGAIFNEPAHTGTGFIPHCTIQKNTRLVSGDTVTIGELAIIDMFPQGDWQQRRVYQKISLQG